MTRTFFQSDCWIILIFLCKYDTIVSIRHTKYQKSTQQHFNFCDNIIYLIHLVYLKQCLKLDLQMLLKNHFMKRIVILLKVFNIQIQSKGVKWVTFYTSTQNINIMVIFYYSHFLSLPFHFKLLPFPGYVSCAERAGHSPEGEAKFYLSIDILNQWLAHINNMYVNLLRQCPSLCLI